MSKRHTETEITATWKHVVPNTLRFETEGHHANKQTVEIHTRDEYGQEDGNTRRIATSDLFQAFWTVEAKERLDKRRRSLKSQLRVGKSGTNEAMAELDSVWRARTELCLLDPDHPRIAEARAKLAEESKVQERREERKADTELKVVESKPSVDEAAELLGVA